MENTFVLSGLKAKRAEIDGELRAAEKRIAQLHVDLEAIDRTIRIFDPTAIPTTIKPKAPRLVAAGQHGGFTRAVLGTLRRAGAPMTARDIANQVAPLFGLDMSAPDKANGAINRVRSALTRTREGVVGDRRGDTIFWRVE